MTENQLDECRDFLFDMGYGWSFCAFSEDKDIVEIMEEQYPTVLQGIKDNS